MRRAAGLLSRLRKRVRYGYVRLVTSPGAPKEIANGAALGLFVAMLPLMGLQMPLAIGVAELLRRYVGIPVSRLTAAAGVWLTNPATMLPIYTLTFVVGRPVARLVLPKTMLSKAGADLDIETAVPELTPDTPFFFEWILSFTVGGIILGVPVAWIGYRLSLRAVMKYQQRAAARKQRREKAQRGMLQPRIPPS